MPRRSRPASEPDLFSLDPAPPRPAPPAEPRAATAPGAGSATSVDDIGRAIAGWSDDELERLRAVVASELRRRGLPRAEPARAQPSASGAKGAAGQAARQRGRGIPAQEVAPGQASAIRAASQAGMGLGKIAREFGLPVATVKRILAASP